LTRAAVEFGFAGALVVPPFYFKDLRDDGVFRYYSELIERVGDERLLLYLYHFPQLSGFGFSPSLVRRLASAFPGTVAGIKDSSGVPGYAESIVAACPALDVFPSSESELGANKARGFAGCISATINVSAPLAGRVWNGAPDANAALGTIRATIAQYALVPAIRAVMASLLKDDGWVRLMPPLIELASSEADCLIAELDAVPEFLVIRERYA
jgi:4-hydroxy-tetrahydrodipicolinate synthase